MSTSRAATGAWLSQVVLDAAARFSRESGWEDVILLRLRCSKKSDLIGGSRFRLHAQGAQLKSFCTQLIPAASSS